MMSEIFLGAPVFIVSGIAAAGSALAELFRQAGVPFKSSLSLICPTLAQHPCWTTGISN